MYALRHFLFWYLGGYSRLDRKHFNIIVALAFLPATVMMVSQWLNKAQDVSQKWDPMLREMGRNLGQSASGGMPDAASTQAAVEAFMGSIQGDDGIAWASVVSLLTFIALLPIVQMRLRDMGKRNGQQMWLWTAAIYAGSAVQLLDMAKISLGALGWLAGGVSFVLLAWICIARGKPVPKPMPAYEKPVDAP